MKRFPSNHGARMVFDAVRSKTPMPGSRPVPRSGAFAREAPRDAGRASSESGRPRASTPSYAEIDVVEANLTRDPRYDPDDD